jgi:transposase-like protein
MLETAVELIPNLVRGQRRDGRCLYDKAAKRELARRCQQPGVSLSRMALAHGLNANVLRRWVDELSGKSRRAKRVLGASVGASGSAVALLPVSVEPPRPTRTSSAGGGYLEITVGRWTLRVHGKIDAESLRAVLDCLAGRA